MESQDCDGGFRPFKSISKTYALIENLMVEGRCCFEHAALHVKSLNPAWKGVPFNKQKLILVVVTLRDLTSNKGLEMSCSVQTEIANAVLYCWKYTP